jgi:peptidyl-prolyl cis-trans isomerase C
MHGHRRIVALGTLLVGLAAPLAAQAQDKVLAKVDGQAITEKDVTAASATLAAQLAQLPEEARKRAVLDRLIDMRIVSTGAAKAGLDQSEAFKSRME